MEKNGQGQLKNGPKRSELRKNLKPSEIHGGMILMEQNSQDIPGMKNQLLKKLLKNLLKK
jgi:hypothetical protein